VTQQEALDILKTGKSAFITGAAGSGKTHLLREYISYLENHDVPVGIAASTGIAATHMGGTTIHSWAGIGVRDRLTDSDVTEIAEKSYLRSRFQNTRVLIIDEVSMLHHFRLDLVDRVLRAARDIDLPFGGIQVVFCGDFFQLPPISRSNEQQARFAYHSSVWQELSPAVCYLEEQYRQNDRQYLSVLLSIRANDVTEAQYELLQSRFGKKLEAPMEPTKLYTHNIDVDVENDRELAKLPETDHTYMMTSNGREPIVMALKKSCLAPEKLRLKVGAKVMFVKNNFEEGYANGTQGVVESCGYDSVVVRTVRGSRINVVPETWRVDDGGKFLAEIQQYPLRLAWAITVHKSQGMSLDAAEIDLSQSFEMGMGYVALSRVRTLEGLSIKGLNQMALRVSEEALTMDALFREQSAERIAYLRSLSSVDLEREHREFIAHASGKKQKKKKMSTTAATRELLLLGKSTKQIAEERSLTRGTILDHVEKLKAKEPSLNLAHLREELPVSKFKKVWAAFQKAGTADGGKRPLSPVAAIVGPTFSYEDLRLVRLFL
jgi:hypothetical protein